MRVFILRGIPGAGKSSWAETAVPGKPVIFSADDFFTDQEGNYNFDPARLEDAHNICLSSYLIHLLQNATDPQPVIVDNCNRTIFEIAPYYRLAELYHFPVEVVWVHCDPEVAANRNTKGVPLKSILQSLKRMEALPEWVNVRHVFSH